MALRKIKLSGLHIGQTQKDVQCVDLTAIYAFGTGEGLTYARLLSRKAS